MPVPRILEPAFHGALARLGRGLDVTAVRLALAVSRGKPSRLRELAERAPYYDAMGLAYDAIDPAEFYAAPCAPAHAVVRSAGLRVAGGAVADLTWPSDYVPRLAPAREAYSRFARNATAHVRLFRHARRAPTVICIHGYRGGSFLVEERAFQVAALFAMGLDVALFTLPFHARRAPGGAFASRAPLFPSQGNIARTNEGFGQAVWDLRALIAWLRREGAPSVGVLGMSLGAYTASLLATVDRSLAFVIPCIPLADITSAVVAHDRMRGIVVDDAIEESSRRALAIHSPLLREPLVTGERVLVLAHEADRITGHVQAGALARHFRGTLRLLRGSHLLHVGRGDALASINRFLAKLELIHELRDYG